MNQPLIEVTSFLNERIRECKARMQQLNELRTGCSFADWATWHVKDYIRAEYKLNFWKERFKNFKSETKDEAVIDIQSWINWLKTEMFLSNSNVVAGEKFIANFKRRRWGEVYSQQGYFWSRFPEWHNPNGLAHLSDKIIRTECANGKR